MSTPFNRIVSAIFGNPVDPNKKPDRLGIVQAFSEMQTQLEAAQSGAIVKPTLAALSAMTTAPYAGIMAWVVNDATLANNGIYENVGTANAPSWTRRTDIPQFFVTGINTGAGTVNAIQVTTATQLPTQDGRCLISVPVLGANTASPPTVQFNGAGTVYPIVTASGTNVVVGGLVASMVLVGYISNNKFQLITDIASAAIQTAAAASAAAAAASAASIDTNNFALAVHTHTAAQLRLGAWTSVASAATVDLGAQTSRNLVITGTTTITSFGTAGTTDGVEYRLRFAGALTLTHGANLILPGATNIVTAAGDVATVVHDGANVWRVVEYSRAANVPATIGTGANQLLQLDGSGRLPAGLAGKLIDRVYAEYTTVAGLTTAIPFDDTIPQNTEGTQVLSASITPKSASNILRVRALVPVSPNNGTAFITAAAFINANVNASCAASCTMPTNYMEQISLEFEYVPASVTAQTISIRVGETSGFFVYINGTSAGRRYGGASRATLIIEEFAP